MTHITPRLGSRQHCVAAVALVLCLAVGCGTPAASVIIDNTSPSTMTVKVDGKQAARIEGHSFQTIRLLPGSYEMEVEVGGRRVFKGLRTIEESDTVLAGKMYLFNPTAKERYAVCKVIYGGSLLSDATEDAFISLAEHYKGEKVDETKLQFYRIKKCAEPLPGGSWFALPGGISYILRDAPESVYTKSAETSRRVLTRISREDHSQLGKAHRIEEPTEKDLNNLVRVTERVLASMSELEPWE
jgi:hypothetical protein